MARKPNSRVNPQLIRRAIPPILEELNKGASSQTVAKNIAGIYPNLTYQQRLQLVSLVRSSQLAAQQVESGHWQARYINKYAPKSKEIPRNIGYRYQVILTVQKGRDRINLPWYVDSRTAINQEDIINKALQGYFDAVVDRGNLRYNRLWGWDDVRFSHISYVISR